MAIQGFWTCISIMSKTSPMLSLAFALVTHSHLAYIFIFLCLYCFDKKSHFFPLGVCTKTWYHLFVDFFLLLLERLWYNASVNCETKKSPKRERKRVKRWRFCLTNFKKSTLLAVVVLVVLAPCCFSWLIWFSLNHICITLKKTFHVSKELKNS